MASTRRILCFVFVMMTVLFGCGSATIYKVGDSDGWTAKDDVYYDWAGTLWLFGIRILRHFSPKAVYNTGHDVVTLTEPGFYYFITSNQAQCASGQKLDVLVVVHDPSSPIPPPPSPSSKILPYGEIYKVGDSEGWSVYNINDVIEINGDLEFISCDPTSPVAVHKTGHDLVRLTEPGVRYFISSEPGRCGAGLKLRVMVQPQPKAVTYPNFPKKKDLSVMDRLNNWLQTFRSQPHH
ncbi:unnamed protein product [Microthlaspi erraticum]|uniref:Phytocyanin domain-containing protein n=1 Tax=Microthlaspi erraticum TaxID=1685480 RepID=A0A6D2L9E3_9BRAS|nr:unnamed protein product [Microthlaspi erraticum]